MRYTSRPHPLSRPFSRSRCWMPWRRFNNHPEIKVLTIEGHTDNQGKRGYNLKLSNARADALRKHMISKGVDAARLKTAGFGPDQPVDTNDTDEGRAKNRRVDFRIDEVTWEEGVL